MDNQTDTNVVFSEEEQKYVVASAEGVVSDTPTSATPSASSAVASAATSVAVAEPTSSVATSEVASAVAPTSETTSDTPSSTFPATNQATASDTSDSPVSYATGTSVTVDMGSVFDPNMTLPMKEYLEDLYQGMGSFPQYFTGTLKQSMAGGRHIQKLSYDFSVNQPQEFLDFITDVNKAPDTVKALQDARIDLTNKRVLSFYMLTSLFDFNISINEVLDLDGTVITIDWQSVRLEF